MLNDLKQILALVIAALLSLPLIAQVDADKKNVLMIVVDDLKPTLGCFGDQHAKTPNFDRLASRGVSFSHAYANQAVCAPSRCSVFSGLRPDRTKVHDLNTDFSEVSPWVVTLPEYFRKHGYITAGSGKLFHGGRGDREMESKAFTKIVKYEDLPYNASLPKPALFYQSEAAQTAVQSLPASQRQNFSKVKKALKDADLQLSGECLDLPDDAYIDGALAKQTIAYIDDFHEQDKPFFISVGFKLPHLPLTAPKKYWDLYDAEALPEASNIEPPKGAPQYAMHSWGELRNYSDIPQKGPLSSEKAKQIVHGYYAGVSYVDAQIGKIIDALDERGLTENTVIALWSDHGYHLGDHGLWCKHSNYEQATRSVMMYSGPGVVANKSTSALAELIDVFPTVCDLAGLEIPPNLDAISLVPVLTGKSNSHREYAQSQYPRWNGSMGYAFRSDRFRYVVWVDRPDPKIVSNELPSIKHEELYDYQVDPLEQQNLAGRAAKANRIEKFRQVAANFLDQQAKRIAQQTQR